MGRKPVIVKVAPAEDIEYICNIPYIYEEMICDGFTGKIPAPDWFEYFGLYDNGDIVGFIALHPKKEGKEMHITLLKGYRHHLHTFTNAVLDNQGAIYAAIPEYNRSVINAAKKFGFIFQGYDGFFAKNGKTYRKELLKCHL